MIEPQEKIYQISHEATLEILYTGSPDYPLADDRTNVFLLTWKDKKILFLNDSGFHFEQWLNKNDRQINADVIVLGKHSQETSINVNSLSKLKPHTVIASNSNFEESQNRTKQWQAQLTEKGITLLLLDETGAVTITHSTDVLKLETFAK